MPAPQKTKMSASAKTALEFVLAAKAAGYDVKVAGDSVVRIVTRFSPGDVDAYVKADREAYWLISSLPGRGGSIWGTTGDGVGGHVGLTRGYYEIAKSGVTDRVWRELAKIV